MSLAVFAEPTSITDRLANVFRDLAGRIDGLAEQYRRAEPYPHIVIDDFLPADLAVELAAEFPNPESPIWHRFPGQEQRNKLQLSDDSRIPPGLRSLVYALNGGQFVGLLEKLTGVANLIADANLVGGGLHQTTTGGKLNVHIDYSHHPRNRLCRRLNLLLYLTPDWHEEWGGHFELWDEKVTKCVQRVTPAFNRVVVFSTSPTSQHGQPQPLACPPGVGRKSVALYYYSNGRPEEAGPVAEHNTIFRPRPGDKFHFGNWVRRVGSGSLIRDLTPPLFYRGLRAAWNARTRTAGK